jgi:iron complex outermembrane receptor protein
MRRISITFLLFCIGICFIGILYAQETQQDILGIQLVDLLDVKISTAAKYEQAISEAPASVTIITSEDIERYGYRTLDEVLMSIRGFYTRNDRNYAYMGIRGFSRPGDYDNRVLVLINGHTLNENVYGAPFFGTDLGMNLDTIERIEIVRGPGSALYGTGAMFAVVNVITKDGNIIDGFKLSAETGSYGRLQGAAVFGKGFGNGIDISVSGLWGDIKGQDLYFEEYDAPTTNYGIAENLDWDKYYGLLTTITYDAFELQGMITSREKGIPTGAWEMIFNEDAKGLDERKFIEFKYDQDIGVDKNIMLRGYFDHYGYRGTYPYEDINWFDANDGNWLGGEFRFRWDIRPDNRLIVGTEYQDHLRADYREWDEDATYFDGNFPFDVRSFYLQDEYQLTENLSLTLGVRRDDYSTVGSSTTPRGAIIYNPMKSGTLKLLYGEAFRAPNVYEVHYESVDEAKGNPDLNPEKVRTMEVIWEQRLNDELLGIVSFYNYDMKELIDQKIDPADSLLQFRNVSKVKAKGIELGLNARLKMGLWGYVNYIFQNAEDAELKEELTNSPSHIMKIGFSCPVMKYLYVAAELLCETERITVHETTTDPYLLANVHLSTKPLFNHLKLSLLGRNLFDTNYRLPGSLDHQQDAIKQDGRNFAAKLEYSL